MTVSVGKILSLIGNKPIANLARKTFAEKLPIARHMSAPPNLNGLLAQVMQNGPAALLKNPMAVLNGQLNSAISQAVSGLAGVAGAGGLITALQTNLSGALTNLTGLQNQLSGLASGNFSLNDIVAHADLAETLGAALPANLSLDKVTKPLAMAAQLTAIKDSVDSVTAQVVAETMTPEAAETIIAAHVAEIETVISACETAITDGQLAVVTLAEASSAIGAVIASPESLQELMQSLIQEDAMPSIQEAIASLNPED